MFQHASGMLVARRIATKKASAEGREAHRDQKRFSFFAFAMRLGSCDTHSSNMFILRYGKVLVASIFQNYSSEDSLRRLLTEVMFSI